MKRFLLFIIMQILILVSGISSVFAQVTFTQPALIKVCDPGVQPLPMIYKTPSGVMLYGCNNQIYSEDGQLVIPQVHYHFGLSFAGDYVYETYYQRLENQFLRVQTNTYPPGGQTEILNTADYDTPGIVTAQRMSAGKFYIFEGDAGAGKQAVFSTDSGSKNVIKLLDDKINSSKVEYDNAALFSVKKADGSFEIIFTKGSAENTVSLLKDDCNVRGGFQGAGKNNYYFKCMRIREDDPEQYLIELWQTDGTANGTRQIKFPLENNMRFREEIGEVNGSIIYIASGVLNTFEKPLYKLLSLSADRTNNKLLYQSEEEFSAKDSSRITENKKSAFIPLRFSDSEPGRSEFLHTDGTSVVKFLETNHPVYGISASVLGTLGKFAFLDFGDDLNGQELWISDGTISGTRLLADIIPGPDNSYPEIFLTIGNALYFRAKIDSQNYGIYKFQAENCTAEDCGGTETEEKNPEDNTGILSAPSKLKVKKRKGLYNFIMQQGESGAVYELVLTMQKAKTSRNKKPKVKIVNSASSTVVIRKLKAGKWSGKYRIKYGEANSQITKYSAEKKFKIKL